MKHRTAGYIKRYLKLEDGESGKLNHWKQLRLTIASRDYQENNFGWTR